jgi:ubiquinone/menaquinone biosynthesis C-methylase UbiE
MNTFSDPLKIIEQIPFPPDSHIADFGCGAGAYSLLLAEKAEVSKIFSIDVRKEMIERLGNIARSEQLHKIHVVWGDVDEENGSRLRSGSVDVVLIINTLFQAEKKKQMIEEAFRVLKRDGKLVIVDWSESFGNIGPKEDHVIKEDTAKLLVEEVGFFVDKKNRSR